MSDPEASQNGVGLALLDGASLRLSPSTDIADAIVQLHQAALLPEAEAHRSTVLSFIAAHPEALNRSCLEGHLTGSAVIVDPQRGQALLMLHRKLGRWFQPGGHADGDANLAGVAWREATEESGIADLRLAVPAIDLDVHEVPESDGSSHLHLDLRYLAVTTPGAVAVGNHESLALRWVGIAEATDLGVDASTLRVVRRGLDLVGSVDLG